MKRSMTKVTSGNAINPSEYLDEESRKFKKRDISCNIPNPGCIKFTTKQRAESNAPQSVTNTSSKTKNSMAVPQVGESLSETSSTLLRSSETTSLVTDTSQEAEEIQLPRMDYSSHHDDECDVKLVTDCGCFMAKKDLLVASSDYFRAMFTLNMAEKSKTNIDLKKLDGIYLRRYLNFVRLGNTQLNGWVDALDILDFAVYLQCSSLIETCCKYLTSHLTSSNASYILLVAHDLALNELIQELLHYLYEHFTELDHTNANVEYLQAEDLLWLLQSEGLGGKSNSLSELSILKIVLRWLLSHETTTETEQESIISNIRFALIQPDCIFPACQEILNELDVDENNNVVSGIHKFGPVFHKHLKSALLYHKDLYNQPFMQTQKTNLRTSNHSWVSIDGVLAPSTITLPSGAQTKVNNSQTHIRDPFHSVVELNGFLFILGGTRDVDCGFSNVVLRYDPRLNSFIQLASMNDRRGDFVAFPYHDRIFVFGGRNKTGGLKSCECYDISSNTWSNVAELPESLYMTAGVATRGKMYLSGGFVENAASAKTFCYDPETDSWEKLPSFMRYPRGYHVMIEGSDGLLWAIGGIDNNLTGRNVWEVEALDLERRTWNFMGYVLPKPLLLYTIRLNVFRKEDGNICISAVSSPDKYPMLEYDDQQRMWTERNTPVPSVGLNLPENVRVK